MPVILGGNTGIYLASLTPPAPQLLLDTYPNAAVAYSLRKLRSTYTGSAIRVRRSVDNAEQDIGFIGNDLDTTSMLDFVGYNLWSYSEDISNAVYSKPGLNTTGTPAYVNVETAPDSTLTGDKAIENTSNSTHGISRSGGTLINGTSYTISAYLKQAERTKVAIASSISGASQECDLDLTNGTVSNSTFANTPVVTAEANGWYRFSVTITSGTTSGASAFVLVLYNASNAKLYTGDGTSGVYVWGFQLTQTSTLKPYEKTVATAAGAGFVSIWYDQSTNANNSTQTTPTSQAQVVLNANLILDAITGKITTTWTTDRYTLTNLITTVQLMYHYMVFNRASNALPLAGLSNSNNVPTMLRWFTTSGEIRSYMNTFIIHSTNTATGSNLITTLRDSSNVVKMFRNNVALTTGVSSDIGATFDSWGNANTSTNSGNFAELVHWNSDQEANRTGIETNANTYWNAY